MRTLYEDWQLRRARLDTAEPLPHCGDQVRVLDYLLKRYANDPIAQQPARHPHSSELVFFNRTLIVHRHLKFGEFIATCTPADAHARAKTILARIAELNPQAHVGTPSSCINFLAPDGPDAAPFQISILGSIDQTDLFVARCKEQITGGATLCNGDKTRLEYLMMWSLRHEKLKASLSAILEVLAMCAYDEITSDLLDFWARGIFPNALDDIEKYLRTNELGAEMLRKRLASGNSAERTFAAHVLGQLGSLNDIGLLQDLLVLPEMKAESPERAAYLNAMKTLAGVDAPI